MSELRLKELRSFAAEADQEEVARAFRRYGLVSAPVVGADGRLLGQITVDDVVDVIDEEAEDDILKLGGVSEADTYVPTLRTTWRRLPWLVVNLFTAMLGAWVISQFEGTIERLVSLAALMPMVAGMGGNAGTQALTVTVRSLAAGEITRANVWRTDQEGDQGRAPERRHLPGRRRRLRARLAGRAGAGGRVRRRPPDQPRHRRRSSASPCRWRWSASARTPPSRLACSLPPSPTWSASSPFSGWRRSSSSDGRADCRRREVSVWPCAKECLGRQE